MGNAKLNEWFSKHVEPINKLLESGVTVYNCKHPDTHNHWFYGEIQGSTYSATLINIQPIKKDTHESLSKELYNRLFQSDGPTMTRMEIEVILEEYHARARAVLGESE